MPETTPASQEGHDAPLPAPQDDFVLLYEQWDKEHAKMKERPPAQAKNYVKHARNLLPLLESLAELHPVAKAVVFSFRAVIDFQYDRIENDIRVYSVFLTASDMMRGVLQIDLLTRKRNDKEIIESNRHLQDRLRMIATDIKECGNAIDTYYKESKLVRFLKVKEWKETIAEFNQAFINHRNALTQALSLRTAQGVDDILATMDSFLKTHFAASEHERKVEQQLRIYGTSPDKWTQDPDKLQKLYLIFPEDPMVDVELFHKDEKHGGGGEDNDTRYRLKSHMAALKEEVAADVKTLCARNKDVFLKKLDFQTTQIQEAISNSAVFIVGQLLGPYDRLKHKDLSKLWKEMNWIFCVESKVFAMALYEYYLDFYSTPLKKLDEDGAEANHRDKWALEYLSAYGQEICEALDTDVSGYIRISEVNAFTDLIPEGWTFPEWCVYHALGWHYEQHIYQKRLQHLLDVFHEAHAFVTPWNRWGPVIRDYYHLPSSMQELIRRKVVNEVEQYRRHFRTFKGHLDSEDTVKMIYKNKALETYILQLCIFIVEQCLDVAQICRTQTVDLRQWIQIDDTIDTVRFMVTGRIGHWEAISQDKRQNTESKLDALYGGLYRVCRLENVWRGEDVPPPVKWSDAEVKSRRQDFHLLSDIPWLANPQCTVSDVLSFPTWEGSHPDADPNIQPPIAWPDSEDEKRVYAEMVNLREESGGNVFPFHNVGCNNCRKYPFNNDTRYCCLDCEDLDFCQDCFGMPFESLNSAGVEEAGHLSDHSFVKWVLYTPGPNDRWMRKLGKFIQEDAFNQFYCPPGRDDSNAAKNEKEDESDGQESDGAAPPDPPPVKWFITCNICHQDVNSGRYFVRCAHQLCDDFDLCQNCAEKNDFPRGPHSEEDYLHNASPNRVPHTEEPSEEETAIGHSTDEEEEPGSGSTRLEEPLDSDEEEAGSVQGSDHCGDEGDNHGDNHSDNHSDLSETRPPKGVASANPDEGVTMNHRWWHTMVVIQTSVADSGPLPSVDGKLEQQAAEKPDASREEDKSAIKKLEQRIEGIENHVLQLKELLTELLERMGQPQQAVST